MDLQGADSRSDVDHAAELHPFQLQHQCVHSQPQREVEDVGSVLDEDVTISLPPVDRARTWTALGEAFEQRRRVDEGARRWRCASRESPRGWRLQTRDEFVLLPLSL